MATIGPALVLPAHPAAAAPIVLTAGAAASTSGSQTIDYVSVSGTSALDGTASTYTADGSGSDLLTIGDDAGVSVTLGDHGTMIATIAVSASGGLTIDTDGSFTAAAPLAIAGSADISAGGTFTAASATTFDGGCFVHDGGTVAIGGSGSVTTGAGQYLYLGGAGALTRAAGGTYSAGILFVADTAAVTFVTGDAVSGDVLVDSGATLTLEASLATGGDLWVSNGGTVVRGSSADTIAATDLHVTGDSAFQSIAGDSFASASVIGGGLFTISAPLSLASLEVSGDDGLGRQSTATIGAATTISDGGSVRITNGGFLDVSSPLSVAPGGVATLTVTGTASDGSASTLHVAAAVSGFSVVSVDSGATLDLGSDLVLSDVLSLSDGASVTRTTATISASSLSISGLSSLALGTGDTIGSLALSGGGRASSSTALVLVGSATPLSIIDPGSLLTLTSFDGLVTTPSADMHFALRLSGDWQSLLSASLSAGRIALGTSPTTPGVIYDPGLYGDATFVGYLVAVPEPSPMIVVMSALAMLPFLRHRRRG